jgi:glyoxylase-like metal-dependent hydrolase (beta-lactamase superfamily II)
LNAFASSDPAENPQQYIQDQEVIDINDYLVYFYWGRHSEHEDFDGRLGGGTFAIYKGDRAIVVDTGNLPGQGNWVKKKLQSAYGIKNFTLVITHWHLDHIRDNYIYEDDVIIGHTDTRNFMLENKEAIENGTLWGPPAFPCVPPNATFEGRFDLWLDDIKIELHEFTIHSIGHIALYLPQDKIFLGADMLEDPIWIFDFSFADADTQIAEYNRMLQFDIEKIFTNHCNGETVKDGGYTKDFIRANRDYLIKMVADVCNAEFPRSPQWYIQDWLDAGAIEWWDPYYEVHGTFDYFNVQSVWEYYGSPCL